MVAAVYDPKWNSYVTADDIECAKKQRPSTWTNSGSLVVRPLLSSDLPFLCWARLPVDRLRSRTTYLVAICIPVVLPARRG